MWNILSNLLSIVIIDLVLSGDNALVIGMACAALPPAQRRRGVMLGSLGAVALRVVLAAVTAVLLRIPLLQALSGLLLIWIAYRLMLPVKGEGHTATARPTLWGAFVTIVLADLVMSLDNVLAIGGAAQGDVRLLLVGLGLSIPMIMWGSGLVVRLLARAPWLTHLGAAVLATTAGRMIAADPAVHLPFRHLLPAAAPCLLLAFSGVDRLRRRS